MYKIIITLLFTTLLLQAQNPYPFSALGDVIYNNAPKIAALKKVDKFADLDAKIDRYMQNVKKTKELGYKLERGQITDKQAYLNRLRSLAKEYDEYRFLVDKNFKKALQNEDVALVSTLINSGLLDTKRYKKEILDFYFEHIGEMKSDGVIDAYLKEDAKLRKKKEAQRKRYLSKKEREQKRIERIRKRDKLEQEKLEKKLQDELIKKKKEIQEYQKRELSKTI
jgi:hypothetical protein